MNKPNKVKCYFINEKKQLIKVDETGNDWEWKWYGDFGDRMITIITHKFYRNHANDYWIPNGGLLYLEVFGEVLVDRMTDNINKAVAKYDKAMENHRAKKESRERALMNKLVESIDVETKQENRNQIWIKEQDWIKWEQN